jgi:hypothetical protein
MTFLDVQLKKPEKPAKPRAAVSDNYNLQFLRFFRFFFVGLCDLVGADTKRNRFFSADLCDLPSLGAQKAHDDPRDHGTRLPHPP